MRHHSPLDRALARINTALNSSVSTAPVSRQPAPLKGKDSERAPVSMDEKTRRHTAGLMRINHTGEVCAQALYQGQALTAKLPDVREQMEHAAAEEIDHLYWCEKRLQELDSEPSKLNPLFYAMSFAIGAMAGAAGDRWSLGFVSETEKQVCAHLQKHLLQLHPDDVRSREILSQMFVDEARHAHTADAAGAAELPAPVKSAMQFMSKVMTGSTYRI